MISPDNKVSRLVYDYTNSKKKLACEEVWQLLAQREQVEKEIAALREELKKETQFSRKVELNMRIKKLEKEKV